MSDRVVEDAAASSLSDLAIAALHSWKIESPGRWTFDRLIGGCAPQGEHEAWRRMAGRLAPELCAAIDRLLSSAST